MRERINSGRGEQANAPVREERGADDDLAEYEVDGWRVGFDVDYRGVGAAIEGYQPVGAESNDETDDEGNGQNGHVQNGHDAIHESDSDWSSDSDTESEAASSEARLDMQPIDEQPCADERPLGYEALAASGIPESMEIGTSSSFVPDSIRKQFEEALGEQPKWTEQIAHQPLNIDLNDEKISAIKTAMSGVTISVPPPWANHLDDEELKEIINRLSKS